MTILIKNANEVITLKNNVRGPRTKEQMQEITIVENGSVLIEEDRIVAVGALEQLEVDFPELVKKATTMDASGKVVMPGLVDCHTHLVHGGTREEEFNMRLNGSTYMEIMNAGGGIHATTKRTRETSFDDLYEKTRKHLDIFLKHGVTTVEAKSGYGLDWETEKKQLEVAKKLQATHDMDVISTFMGAHAVPRDYKGREDEFVDVLIHEMLPKVAELELAEFNDVFCEKGVFTPEQSERILEAGKDLGLTPKIHADEIEPYKGAELAAEVGAISAEHLLVASDEGIQKMAEAGTIAVLLPGTAFFLRAPFARGRLMIDEGVPVAISTDFNPGSSPTMSLPFIMNLACMHMGMTLEEVLTATTINAAYAVNRGEQIGSLEVDKKADVIILDVANYKQLQYFYGMNHTNTVIKNGKVVVQNGILLKEQ
ncbi:imidazolonepropionase [Lysinibacillus fusiformis]|uniref:imidazolonepropionase n=1 Tax=Lysinibacillus fusiformis TaxID=28031 RepID=UPI001E2E82C5|nr:imidazolonepropionase [Lysinibacillus fusiformis]MCE4046674.1 imidazolonepropionase [Lysinibacillus fusiformis]MCT6816098.1 imidazolonepropionase [Lysinibacillus fusiformis]MCT6930306.1 imidazolonepropionase [Lysinibacillus fusiformis]MCT6934554.1 imidazolonepropionase [Lysinibacillus fusiformis]WEA39568.1 imidazolonepropionase [Lysinibacillus fusiformis]